MQSGQPDQGQAASSGQAEQAIQMIQHGYETLGKMIQAAGQNVSPDDVKLFQQAATATDNMVQSLMGAPQEEAPEEKPEPSGPMPDNANKNAQPAPQY